jgi:hypothetical protein
MALVEEMRILVGNLQLTASRRAQEESERRETASRDARERAAGTASRRAEVSEKLSRPQREHATQAWDARGRGAVNGAGRGAGVGLGAARGSGRRERSAGDAAERAAGMAALRNEVAETLGRLKRDRAVQSTWDGIEREEDERERRMAAAEDARKRSAEILGLRTLWSDHAARLSRLSGRVVPGLARGEQ